MLIFQKDTMKKICSHARTEYPNECCGILLGKHQTDWRTVSRIVPTENLAEAGEKTTHFSIDPLELVRIERFAGEEGLEIVGFYHSHPDCDAIVSKTDALHMIEGYSYPILSVKDGKCVEVNSFEKTARQELLRNKKNIGCEMAADAGHDSFFECREGAVQSIVKEEVLVKEG